MIKSTITWTHIIHHFYLNYWNQSCGNFLPSVFYNDHLDSHRGVHWCLYQLPPRSADAQLQMRHQPLDLGCLPSANASILHTLNAYMHVMRWNGCCPHLAGILLQRCHARIASSLSHCVPPVGTTLRQIWSPTPLLHNFVNTRRINAIQKYHFVFRVTGSGSDHYTSVFITLILEIPAKRSQQYSVSIWNDY